MVILREKTAEVEFLDVPRVKRLLTTIVSAAPVDTSSAQSRGHLYARWSMLLGWACSRSGKWQ